MRVLAGSILAAVAVLYLCLTSPAWLISPDSTDYVEGARSLVRLHGYLDTTGAPQTLAPPGTSFVYAVAAAIPSADFFSFNLLTKFLAIAFIALAYLVARRSAGDVVALILVLFLALSERILSESTRILSDIPFSVVFMLTLWLFPEDALEEPPVGSALALGGLVALCYLMRTAGLFVLLGYVVYVALFARAKRLRTIACVSGVFAVVAGLLWLRARYWGGGPSYLQLMFLRESWVMDSGFPSPGEWIERIVSNGEATLRAIYIMLSNQYRVVFSGVVICALAAAGFAAALVRRRALLYACLLVCYLPALLPQPFPPDPRYLLPILPLLALCAAFGAEAIVDMFPSQPARTLVQLALVAAVVINPYWPSGVGVARDLRGDLRRTGAAPIVYRRHETFQALVERHRGTLAPTDVVATMHANILRYLLPAGTRVSNIPLTNDVERSYRALREAGTTVLYCDRGEPSWRYLEPVILTHAAAFQLVDENQSGAIYQFRP
jgi:4-amino-4-deoxy-L-arabinose transferase-like glycosyltransferase